YASILFRHTEFPADGAVHALANELGGHVSDLKGKVAIVTGGGQGIGRAITLRLAAEGCKVAVFDLKPEAAEATAEEARAKGGEVKVYGVDISDQEAVNKAVQQAEADLGPTWMLVNN